MVTRAAVVSGLWALEAASSFLLAARSVSAPGRIRTYGTRFRKPMLYPLSYGGGPEASSVGIRTGRTPPDTGRTPQTLIEAAVLS